MADDEIMADYYRHIGICMEKKMCDYADNLIELSYNLKGLQRRIDALEIEFMKLTASDKITSGAINSIQW